MKHQNGTNANKGDKKETKLVVHKQLINECIGGPAVKSKYSEILKKGQKNMLMDGTVQIIDASNLKPAKQITWLFCRDWTLQFFLRF